MSFWFRAPSVGPVISFGTQPTNLCMTPFEWGDNVEDTQPFFQLAINEDDHLIYPCSTNQRTNTSRSFSQKTLGEKGIDFLNQFQILRLIGNGKSGVAFLCRLKQTKEDVVIKFPIGLLRHGRRSQPPISNFYHISTLGETSQNSTDLTWSDISTLTESPDLNWSDILRLTETPQSITRSLFYEEAQNGQRMKYGIYATKAFRPDQPFSMSEAYYMQTIGVEMEQMLRHPGYHHVHCIYDYNNEVPCIVSKPHNTTLGGSKIKYRFFKEDGEYRLDDQDMEDWTLISRQLGLALDYMVFMRTNHNDIHRDAVFCDLAGNRIMKVVLGDFGESFKNNQYDSKLLTYNEDLECWVDENVRARETSGVMNALKDMFNGGVKKEGAKFSNKILEAFFKFYNQEGDYKTDFYLQFMHLVGGTRPAHVTRFQECQELESNVNQTFYEKGTDFQFDLTNSPILSDVVSFWRHEFRDKMIFAPGYGGVNDKQKLLNVFIMQMIRQRKPFHEIQVECGVPQRDYYMALRVILSNMAERKQKLSNPKRQKLDTSNGKSSLDELGQIERDEECMAAIGMKSIEEIDTMLKTFFLYEYD